MNVLVIGANGQVGQHLVRKLQQSADHHAVAMVRKKEQAVKFEEQGVKTALVDLEGSIDEIANAMKDVDAVVFTAGSGEDTGADKLLLIDLDGAIKSMKAAEQVGVKRFVIVSGLNIQKFHDNNHADWMKDLMAYGAAKYYADAWLEHSKLEYTIVRPGGLTNEPGTGKVKVATDLDFAPISREDVASVIIASLNDKKTIGKAFDVIGGDSPIEQVLKTL
ncbi:MULTISPECIES: SDR family oxidoreductase [Staphylococcaceae]|uniref:SDR family oxidoreductase n=1 Tax=Staphylococcaceae TaxID=90964 RepID=UPI001EF506A2|nr:MULTISPECIES: SDR family oxidoreductase [Staphylococcaceae]MCG7333621.1 SDR family oxidoreductase [Salinicoccus roseus]MEB7787059.1 SDR family oxidoreductase [Staphylococcus equorum]